MLEGSHSEKKALCLTKESLLKACPANSEDSLGWSLLLPEPRATFFWKVSQNLANNVTFKTLDKTTHNQEKNQLIKTDPEMKNVM
jgi:hypothetical protein